MDTETNFVVTVGFTTKVDHQTTSKISRDFRSCLMIDLGRETDGNNEICLGVHFALCIIKDQYSKLCAVYEKFMKISRLRKFLILQ